MKTKSNDGVCWRCGFPLEGFESDCYHGICVECERYERLVERILPSASQMVAVTPANEPEWFYKEPAKLPPVMFDFSKDPMKRAIFAEQIAEAGKWAYQSAQLGNGKHDPSAFLDKLVEAMLGVKPQNG